MFITTNVCRFGLAVVFSMKHEGSVFHTEFLSTRDSRREGWIEEVWRKEGREGQEKRGRSGNRRRRGNVGKMERKEGQE